LSKKKKIEGKTKNSGTGKNFKVRETIAKKKLIGGESRARHGVTGVQPPKSEKRRPLL